MKFQKRPTPPSKASAKQKVSVSVEKKFLKSFFIKRVSPQPIKIREDPPSPSQPTCTSAVDGGTKTTQKTKKMIDLDNFKFSRRVDRKDMNVRDEGEKGRVKCQVTTQDTAPQGVRSVKEKFEMLARRQSSDPVEERGPPRRKINQNKHTQTATISLSTGIMELEDGVDQSGCGRLKNVQ